MDEKYKIVCIGGGSIKGICDLGALYFLHSKGIYDYKAVHTFIGTSVGSAISLLLAVGYTPMEIFTKVTQVKNWVNFDIENIMGLNKTKGLFDIGEFTEILEEMVEKKLHFVPTLRQLYEFTGKKLIVTVTNATKNRIEYLDIDTEPHISCIKAVEMSCSIPIIFRECIYNGDHYVDGALLNNFPINKYTTSNEKIIGICIENIYDNSDFADKSWSSLLSYIYAMFNIPINNYQREQLQEAKKKKNCLIIELMVENVSGLNFSPTEDTKMDLFHTGFVQARQKCEEEWLVDFA